jgi:hypothetical protein
MHMRKRWVWGKKGNKMNNRLTILFYAYLLHLGPARKSHSNSKGNRFWVEARATQTLHTDLTQQLWNRMIGVCSGIADGRNWERHWFVWCCGNYAPQCKSVPTNPSEVITVHWHVFPFIGCGQKRYAPSRSASLFVTARRFCTVSERSGGTNKQTSGSSCLSVHTIILYKY